jgi:hypothetical protein
MNIFSEKGFEAGKWAGEIARSLRSSSIIPDLIPKARVWRATWKQWIQFEDPNLSGPAFWIGKPGIISSKDALYIGYYVERGLPKEESSSPLYKMTSNWHWNGFSRCLNDKSLQKELNSYLVDLNNFHSCIWLHTDKSEECIDYKDDNSLSEVKMIIDSIPSNLWIDVILGIYFSKEECLERQNKIISELPIPIIRAYEIAGFVNNAMN